MTAFCKIEAEITIDDKWPDPQPMRPAKAHVRRVTPRMSGDCAGHDGVKHMTNQANLLSARAMLARVSASGGNISV